MLASHVKLQNMIYECFKSFSLSLCGFSFVFVLSSVISSGLLIRARWTGERSKTTVARYELRARRVEIIFLSWS